MKTAVIDVPGIGPKSEKILAERGFKTLGALASATVEKLTAVPGFGVARASLVIKTANELLSKAASGDSLAVSPVMRQRQPSAKKTVKKKSNANKEKLRKDRLKKIS